MNCCDENEIFKTRLKDHQVLLTKNRIMVFKLLSECSSAISVSDIIKQSEVLLDRISVYRTLKYFLRKGIVAEVPNAKGVARYILATYHNKIIIGKITKCAYFFCTNCERTEPIFKPVHLKPVLLTKNLVKKYSVILEGLCNNCA